MSDVKTRKTNKPATTETKDSVVDQMAKGMAGLPPFSFTARAGAGGKMYIHSQKWRKGYEDRKAANERGAARRKAKAM